MAIYNYQLKHDQNGRIVEKTETVMGEPIKWTYAYDKDGRLTSAHLDGRKVCECHYDKEGRRIQDVFPMTCDSWNRKFEYRPDNRLMRAGDNRYTHDKNGFRSIWNNRGTYTTYEYTPDYRLLKAEVEGKNRVFEFSHGENGQREAKFLNGDMVEAYKWLDFVRLAAFHDGEYGYQFIYEEDSRLPYAMQREDGTIFSLYYDQVGSLRAVADDAENVVKEILYEPFGGIIKDSAPAFRIPIGFAGGLHDRDLGFVRFGWRDYDTLTGRWTAPDPMGDAGGDPDWYGYCLDDPVNGIDPLGLVAFGGMGIAIGLGAIRAASMYGPTIARTAARVARPAVRTAKQFGAKIQETVNAYGPDINVYGGFVADQYNPEKPSYRDLVEEAYNKYSAWADKMEKEKIARDKNQAKKEALAKAIAKALEAKKAQQADENARERADKEVQKRSRERARKFVNDAQDRIDRGNAGSAFDDGYDAPGGDFSTGGRYGRQAR